MLGSFGLFWLASVSFSQLAQLDKNRPLLGLLYGWLTGCCGWLQAPQGFGFQSLPLFLAKIQLKNGIFWACMVLN